MRNPNGYGTVIKLKGNRRRPYVVRKTVGWDGDTRIIKPIGYYATREEAMLALAEYNKSPYDLDARKITMAELYARWEKRMNESGHLSQSAILSIRSAYNKWCRPLHGVIYRDIRAYMMQERINSTDGSGVGNHIKKVFSHLDKFAMEFDIIDKMYSNLTRVTMHDCKKERTVFSDSEVARIWNSAGDPWVDTVLILLYSGWRIQELLNLKKADVDLKAGTMRGGIKTAAGKGRLVPIHSAIFPIVERRYGGGNSHLIEIDGKEVGYDAYRNKFKSVMSKLGMNHTTRETRRTFRTWLDKASAPLACASRIMGHTCKDIGLQVYTVKTTEELRATIELINADNHRYGSGVNNT
ncbi:MAG: tyrosine-type recombinase/integrase [Chitinispirillales bacterium]|jgi:integrase|nr:tyrosine-type recombinase/integrase [Chitinispirillales bacterium]